MQGPTGPEQPEGRNVATALGATARGPALPGTVDTSTWLWAYARRFSGSGDGTGWWFLCEEGMGVTWVLAVL